MSLDRFSSDFHGSSERIRVIEEVVKRVGEKIAVVLDDDEFGDLALSAYEEIHHVLVFAEYNPDVISSELLDKSRIYDGVTMEGKIRHWFSNYIESSIRPGVEERGNPKERAAFANLVKKLSGNSA